MQELQKAQNLVTNTKDWQAYEEKIEDIKKKMSELRGDAKEVGNGGELENVTVRAPKLYSTVRTYRQDNNTMSALGTFISDLKKSVQDTDIGSEIQQKTIERLKDATMVQDVIKQMIEDGVKGADLDGIATMLKDALVLGDIDEEEWKEFEEKINEQLKELNIDPISINVKTGEVGKKMKTDWQDAAKAVESVGSAMSQIEDPAAKVMGTVAQAIASIALGAAEAIKQPKPWPAWIAFAAAATATMISTIATIHSATGYAQGGIVDGTQGGFVGGMAYSGDNVGNVRLNSGEVVLNHAQQSNLAAELEGNPMQNLHLSTTISGRFLKIAIDNDSRSRNKGKLVTTNQ
jgi:hypothetical protein